ncbi:MAG TPA: efflux RND transporter periplasmic adaptor subunit [Acidobacteriaceae bacterium]|nr:efflux RND transporter periplasmic adaptor subunit [Acidobacteriaceae bacterium]
MFRSNVNLTNAAMTRRIALAAIVVLAALCGCSGSGDDNSPPALVTVQAEKPTTGPISEHVVADAVLSPLAQAAISPKISAPVKKFYVQRGTHVRAGELLATLDNRDLAASALDSKGQYEAAQADYATQTQATLPEGYAKAKLDAAQAKAQVQLAQSIVNSRQKLFNQGAIAGRDLDTSKAELVAAQAAYKVALNHFQDLQRVGRDAAFKGAQGNLTSAKGKYMSAEAQLSYSEIRSPINGVVTDRPLFAGETASAGTALITVMDTSALLAKVHLAQMVAQRLHVGDTAQMEIPGVDGTVPAKVSLISPALDPGSTTVEVWLRIDNKHARYKVGTPVHAIVTGREITSAVQVPLSAVLTAEDGSKSVMIVGSDNEAHSRPVSLGISNGTAVQITSGISPNDLVITVGSYGLDNGTKVKVAAPGDKGDSGDDH